jgi:hypothetical protein
MFFRCFFLFSLSRANACAKIESTPMRLAMAACRLGLRRMVSILFAGEEYERESIDRCRLRCAAGGLASGDGADADANFPLARNRALA